MPVVQTWDFANRRIYMGVATWHPIDVYREYREVRRTSEEARKFEPLLRMDGNVAKGGGRFTPRYMVMLNGTKIVPRDGTLSPITNITGEIITDDQTAFIDTSPLTIKPQIDYEPPAAEIITVSTGGSTLTEEQIAQAVWQYLKTNPTTANSMKQVVEQIKNETVLIPATL